MVHALELAAPVAHSDRLRLTRAVVDRLVHYFRGRVLLARIIDRADAQRAQKVVTSLGL